ncbi:MAG: cell division protein ZipA C-terminal FtsZ-binding domain-containing protein, partial [Pseudomonadales bacterium]
MDIKDFILIVGGLLIAAVIAHGFWIAWRARSEPLRLDIVPELIPEDHDEMDRFRGELPNGGARPILSEQGSFELESSNTDAPLLLEPSAASDAARRALDLELLGDPQEAEAAIAKRAPTPRARRRPKGPDLFTIPEGYGPDEEEMASSVDGVREPTVNDATAEPKRPRVAEVTLPGVPEGRDPLVTEPKPKADLRPRRAANQNMAERSVSSRNPRRLGGAGNRSGVVAGDRQALESGSTGSAGAEPVPIEELIMIHLLSKPGECFDGATLLAALRKQGLKFGEMNIFHRNNPMLKSPVYSVANAVEPGFFDLSDMEAMSTPGVTFFLQLPGPEEPMGALEDMLNV